MKPGGLQGAARGGWLHVLREEVPCASQMPALEPWLNQPPPSTRVCWFVSPLSRCTFVRRSKRAAWRGPPRLRESQRSVSQGAEL